MAEQEASVDVWFSSRDEQLPRAYLFSEMAREVEKYRAAHPGVRLCRLGIGDATRPIGGCIVAALHRAVAERGDAAHFRGYAPDGGYAFARQAIAGYYARRGVGVSADEIFVSDGAKSDLFRTAGLFGSLPAVLPDPGYPAYADDTLLVGREIIWLRGNKDNGFLPSPDALERSAKDRPCLIYLCSPANPSGTAYTKEGLQAWVNHAKRTESILLFDAAYEAFLPQDAPHSIYEAEGAQSCAVELCSLSKSASFTGMRFGWTVVPAALTRRGQSLRDRMARRTAATFNGVPYIVQRAAEAALSEEGRRESASNVGQYLQSAACLASALSDCGIRFFGGAAAPYLWVDGGGREDRALFREWLEAGLITTPGSGFGAGGRGYLRLSSFAPPDEILLAAERIRKLRRG